jgi:glycosyltransferase involved in cell wall biosynthesis
VVKHGISRNLALENKARFRITFWRDPSFENGADIAFSVFKRLAVIFPKITFTMMVRPHWNPLVIDSDIDNLEVYKYPYPGGVSLEGVLSETIACFFPFRKLSTNPQLCILESLLSGIPCIVSNVGSVSEYVLDERYLLENNTVDEGVKKLSSYLNSVEEISLFTSPIKNGFHWESFISTYVNIYENGENRDN